jgi:hypothetical protein
MRFAWRIAETRMQTHTNNNESLLLLLTEVSNILQLDNNAMGSICCICMATVNTIMSLTDTSTPITSKAGAFLRLHGKNGYANTPHCNIVFTLSVLSFSYTEL